MMKDGKMVHKYESADSIHVPTVVLELLAEARLAAEEGDSAKSQSLLAVSDAYKAVSPSGDGVAYTRKRAEERLTE